MFFIRNCSTFYVLSILNKKNLTKFEECDNLICFQSALTIIIPDDLIINRKKDFFLSGLDLMYSSIKC